MVERGVFSCGTLNYVMLFHHKQTNKHTLVFSSLGSSSCSTSVRGSGISDRRGVPAIANDLLVLLLFLDGVFSVVATLDTGGISDVLSALVSTLVSDGCSTDALIDLNAKYCKQRM